MARSVVCGFAYHVFNRGNDKRVLFPKPNDYARFLRLLRIAPSASGIRLLAFCLMPNHWHLAILPQDLPSLSAYMHWVTTLHGRQWRRDYGRDAPGHVYQGRYRSIPILTDEHLLVVLRYIEANPVRAGLVSSARDWPWSSRSKRAHREAPKPAPWPWPIPSNWEQQLDAGQPQAQIRAIRAALMKSVPIAPEPLPEEPLGDQDPTVR
jgi:putative transposase